MKKNDRIVYINACERVLRIVNASDLGSPFYFDVFGLCWCFTTNEQLEDLNFIELKTVVTTRVWKNALEFKEQKAKKLRVKLRI